MRSILAAVLALIFLAIPAQAAKCDLTVGNFLFKATSSQATVFVASDRALPIILAKLTEVGKSKGLPPVNGDKVYLAFTKSEAGTSKAGLFVFNDGCLVKDAVIILPAPVMMRAMVTLGLDADDFTVQEGA